MMRNFCCLARFVGPTVNECMADIERDLDTEVSVLVNQRVLLARVV